MRHPPSAKSHKIILQIHGTRSFDEYYVRSKELSTAGGFIDSQGPKEI